MIIEEIIDDVKMFLNMGGALPDILPEKEIRRIIMRDAMPWFYKNVHFSVIKSYLYVPNSTLQQEEFTKYSHITLPCEVQSITWIYQTENRSMFELGVSAPDLSVSLGVTNQPYMSSATTQIGELGVYKVILDGFADMLNQLTKQTLKYDYNAGANRLHILTRVSRGAYTTQNSNLVLECYMKIPQDDLFELDLFQRYVRAVSNMQLGRMLLRYDYKLPGGVTMSSDSLLSDGKEMLQEIKDEVKNTNTNSSFFIMTKR